MPTRTDRADRFRAQAADMLKFAARTGNAAIKAEYERLAAEYDKLAAEMDEDAKRERS